MASSATSCQCSTSCRAVQMLSDQASAFGCRHPEDRQHHAPHRVGRQLAVADEVVEGLVTGHRFGPGGWPGPGRRAVRTGKCAGAGRSRRSWQRAGGARAARSAAAPSDQRSCRSTSSRAANRSPGVVVSQLVHEPCPPVERHEVGAQACGQEPGRYGEVLAASATEHEVVRGELRARRHGRSPQRRRSHSIKVPFRPLSPLALQSSTRVRVNE